MRNALWIEVLALGMSYGRLYLASIHESATSSLESKSLHYDSSSRPLECYG